MGTRRVTTHSSFELYFSDYGIDYFYYDPGTHTETDLPEWPDALKNKEKEEKYLVTVKQEKIEDEKLKIQVQKKSRKQQKLDSIRFGFKLFSDWSRSTRDKRTGGP